MVDDQAQPTSGEERAIERLQLVGVVLIASAGIGARVVDKATSISNWVVYGVAVIVIMTVAIGGTMIVGRVEHRPARDVARDALRETTSDLKRKMNRFRRR